MKKAMMGLKEEEEEQVGKEEKEEQEGLVCERGHAWGFRNRG